MENVRDKICYSPLEKICLDYLCFNRFFKLYSDHYDQDRGCVEAFCESRMLLSILCYYNNGESCAHVNTITSYFPMGQQWNYCRNRKRSLRRRFLFGRMRMDTEEYKQLGFDIGVYRNGEITDRYEVKSTVRSNLSQMELSHSQVSTAFTHGNCYHQAVVLHAMSEQALVKRFCWREE